jgi:Asp-tRNA(Asn)/Glu-tRNA(Gln) amidotransferase A subunit family amidase
VLTPTTPYPAPRLGQERAVFDGRDVPARSYLGAFTQPMSLVGLPAVSVPVVEPGALPVAVQLVAAPWNDAAVLRTAAALEAAGVVVAPIG